MTPSRNRWVVSFVILSALAWVACGGDSPFSPSKQGVVLKGTVLGNGATGASAQSVGASSATTPIVVTVDGTTISTTVGADGTFTLRGLPSGSFTLTFTHDGVVAGSQTFDGVLPNQEITITVVQNADGTVTVVEEKRDGIGHGDIEIEGLVEAVLLLDPAADSQFLIDGHTVIARPGQTAIREGNQARTVNDVTEGRQVHVKGVWETPVGTTTQLVLAHEIKLQDDDDDDDDDTDTCMIEGGKVGRKIELEGNVASGNGDSFELKVKGNRASGLVDVAASGANFQCSGKGGKPSSADCKAKISTGDQIHVSGNLDTCDASSAQVTASKVILQKDK